MRTILIAVAIIVLVTIHLLLTITGSAFTLVCLDGH
jgi:hypothetical protein